MKYNILRVIYLKNLRIGILLMILFVLLATALPIISAGIYKNFSGKGENNEITLYFHESKTIERLTRDDYLLGLLLAHVDTKYGDETLRAAAIAMRSAALYLKGACGEICRAETDYCTCEGNLTYIKREEYIKTHAENGEEHISRLMNAIKDTSGEILLYKNSYALALVHKSSHITTESSFNAFGRQYPYLEPVITSEKAEINEVFVLESELIKKLNERDFAGTAASPEIHLNNAGRVQSVKIFAKEITASDFAETFSLRSLSFDIEEAYGGIVIRTYGDGHDVGLSLDGAEKMSENGFSYDRILLYYFRGCKIISET